MHTLKTASVALLVALYTLAGAILPAQQAHSASAPTSQFVALSGSLAPIVANAHDLGVVDRSLQMDHMLLQLKRSPAQESAVRSAIAELNDPKSPRFHKWMTADEFGQRFGASSADLQRVTSWLGQNGFTVNAVGKSRNVIDFSGSVTQVEQGFQVAMHSVETPSGTHMTNMSAPMVPSALADLIEGVPLSDFKPHPLVSGARSVKRDPSTGQYTQEGGTGPDTTPGLTTTVGANTYELVTPGDFAKIYNLKPLWDAGYAGKGQTVAVVENTLMYAPDVATFRKAFGLSSYAGTFSQGSPAGSHPCLDPGINSDSIEAALDVEWAGATAPDANIYLAGCQDTLTQFGGLLAVMNLLSQAKPPQAISVSYGFCEAEMGGIQINQFTYAFQQAVAEGVAVFVSSGDEGPASCDANQRYAQHGLHTSGFATTPYNVAVGGTDFNDFLTGTTSQYWSPTNSANFVSALSYVPEKTWNNSCADSALLAFAGATQAYGPTGYCNNAGSRYVTTASGSGGPSAVYAKPSWQSVAGNPTDDARDIPDISLFSASGFYRHGLVFCDTQKKYYGVPCDFTNPANATLDFAGGTSFASPAMAGIYSLITQKYGRQGNPNVALYALARAQYGTTAAPSASTVCDSSLGSASSSACVFHDVTAGSIDLPCIGSLNCFGSTETINSPTSISYKIGAMSTSSTSFDPIYPTTKAWDFATGLGTIDATNLFNSWASVVSVPASPPVGGQSVYTPPSPVPTELVADYEARQKASGVQASETPYDRILSPVAREMQQKLLNSGVKPGLNANDAAAVAAYAGKFGGFQTVPMVPAVSPNDQTRVYVGLSMDVNGDKKMDLVTVQTDGMINVLLNPGTGNFSDFKVTSTNSSAVTTGVAFVHAYATDINHDGYPDILALDTVNNAAFVYLNKKDGTFANPIEQDFTFPNSATFLTYGGGVVAMDTNGDGIVDLVACTHYNTRDANYNPVATLYIQVATGNANGSFNAPVEQDTVVAGVKISQGYGQLIAADMNKDGKLDLVFPMGITDSNYKNSHVMVVGLNTGKTTFSSLPTGVPASGIGPGLYSVEGSDAVADVNGDGIPDILYGPGIPGVYLSLGNGDGTMQNPKRVLTQPGTPHAGNSGTLNFADVNGDGIVDVINYAGGFTAVYLGTGNGAFNPGPLVQLISGQTVIAEPMPADFNGDGKTDIAVVDVNSLTFGLFAGGNGTFSGPTAIAPSGEPALDYQVIATGDFNGDGIPDVVAYDEFSSSNSFQPDIVVGLNDGKGNFKHTIALSNTILSKKYMGQPEPFAVDLNGDGKLDLIFDGYQYAQPITGPFLAFNNGDNTFAAPVALPLALKLSCGLSYIDVGDLNGDKKPDIIAAYAGDNSCSAYQPGNQASGFFVFLNQGAGKFTSSFYPYGYAAYLPKLVDLNGDGKLDLVLSDVNSSQAFYELYAIPGKGDGTFDFGNSQMLLENTIVTSIITGDFDGDGKKDLAVGVFSQVDGNDTPIVNTTGVYVMKGNGDFTFQLPVQYSSGAYPLNGTVADVNGDGRPDIVMVVTPFIYASDIETGNFITLLNLGGGTFAQSPASFTSRAGVGVPFVADFNGDGAADALLSIQTVKPANVVATANIAELFLNAGGIGGTLTSSSKSITQFSSVTLTETLTPTVSTTVPTGSVTFFNNGVALQTVSVQSGAASLVLGSLPVGTDNLTATYSGDANYNPLSSSATVAVVVAPLAPDFTVNAPSPASLALTQGQTGTAMVSLLTNAAFSGTITLTCSNAPAEVSCMVSPGSLTLTAGQALTATVVVATTAPNNSSHAGNRTPGFFKTTGTISLGTLLLLLPLRRRFRSSLWHTLSLCFLGLCVASSTIGCGSTAYPGTAVGSYNLTITATAGSVSHNTTIVVAVGP